MGIVSYCPKGHRVKVKDRLAGRKGICPTCGAKFRIPLASAAPTARIPGIIPSVAAPAVAAAAAEVPVETLALPVAAVVSLDAAIAAGLPPVLPLVATAMAEHHAAPPADTLEPAADEEGEPELEVAEEADPLPAVIAEAPGASWCVAVPGGEASNPMSGDAMLEWLGSGEATGSELVWRSDWPDWRPIDAVFPEWQQKDGGAGGLPWP